LQWVGIFQPDYLHQLIDDSHAIDPVEHFRGYFTGQERDDPLAELLAVNLSTYVAGDLLVKTDRMTMANSLQTRCPFLDHELLEYANRIPLSLKLKGMTTKHVLKRAMEETLPREIVWRKKQGFGVPIGQWFRDGLKNFLCDNILSQTALRRGYFDERAVCRLVAEHLSGKRDHGRRLWALLTLEIWHQLFIDSDVRPWLPMAMKPSAEFCPSSVA
jgi:asparagine synthase (glutamine-hydrolysing)